MAVFYFHKSKKPRTANSWLFYSLQLKQEEIGINDQL